MSEGYMVIDSDTFKSSKGYGIGDVSVEALFYQEEEEWREVVPLHEAPFWIKERSFCTIDE